MTAGALESSKSRGLASILALLAAIIAGLLPLLVFEIYQLPWWMVLAGVVLAYALTTLGLIRYSALVFLVFALSSLVRVEPAPTDVLFAFTLILGFLLGHLTLSRVLSDSSTLAALYLFAAANVLSLVNAASLGYGLRYFGLTVYMFALFYFMPLYINSKSRMRVVVVGYIVAVVIACGLGVMGLLKLGPFADVLMYGGRRVMGFFKDPNVFAPFLIPAALWMLDEILESKLLRWPWWLKALISGLSVIFVFFSFSRGAWIQLGVSVMVYALFWLRRADLQKMGRLVLLALGVSGLLAALVWSGGWGSFFMQRLNLQAYDIQRFDKQLLALFTGAENPLGIGPGQSEDFLDYATHSTYLRVWIETGWLGLLSFLFFLGVLLRRMLERAFAGQSVFGISGRLLAAVSIGVLINGFFIDTLHWRHFWWWLGLIAVHENGDNESVKV